MGELEKMVIFGEKNCSVTIAGLARNDKVVACDFLQYVSFVKNKIQSVGKTDQLNLINLDLKLRCC